MQRCSIGSWKVQCIGECSAKVHNSNAEVQSVLCWGEHACLAGDVLNIAGESAMCVLMLTLHSPCMLNVQGCDELRTATEGALRVLMWTLRSPWVLPGGGAWQGALATRLRARARALARRNARASSMMVCEVGASVVSHGVWRG